MSRKRGGEEFDIFRSSKVQIVELSDSDEDYDCIPVPGEHPSNPLPIIDQEALDDWVTYPLDMSNLDMPDLDELEAYYIPDPLEGHEGHDILQQAMDNLGLLFPYKPQP